MAITDRQQRLIDREAKKLGIDADELLRRIVDAHFLEAETRRRTAERLEAVEKRLGQVEPQLRAVSSRIRVIEIARSAMADRLGA